VVTGGPQPSSAGGRAAIRLDIDCRDEAMVDVDVRSSILRCKSVGLKLPLWASLTEHRNLGGLVS